MSVSLTHVIQVCVNDSSLEELVSGEENQQSHEGKGGERWIAEPAPRRAEVKHLRAGWQLERGALLFKSESIPKSSFPRERSASALFWP